jgi:hypothetical protein
MKEFINIVLFVILFSGVFNLYVYINISSKAIVQEFKALDKRVYQCESVLGFIEGELKHME